jgi:hypothetical protein
MKRMISIGALMMSAGLVNADIADNFEGYAIGELPGGVWQDAANFVDSPTNPGDSISVIQTVDAFGNSTRAVQIGDQIGTSGGLMASVTHSDIQRFEIDVRLDQRGNGSTPNWMSAVGFFQDTAQSDFNWSPQAMVYASGNGRFRLFVQNRDGQGSFARDFGLGNAQWSMDTWMRISLEADTTNGIFDVLITDIASGDVIADVSRTYVGWDAQFGQYDLVSANDGEYGSNPGTIANKSTFDNANYIPAPGAMGIIAFGGLCAARRRRIA